MSEDAPINNASVVTITLSPAIERSIWIDGFTPGEINHVSQEQTAAGGEGINVAKFLTGYGIQAAVSGFLGQENTQPFTDCLSQHGITDQFVRINGRTQTNIKIVDGPNQQATTLTFAGQPPSAENLDSLWLELESLAESAEWFVLCGHLPPQIPPTFYPELITKIKEWSQKSALRLNDETLRQAVSAAPDLVLATEKELEVWEGRPLESLIDILSAADNLHNQGIETVIIWRGGEGAFFVNAEQTVRIIPPRKEMVRFDGVLEAMLAGALLGKIQGLPFVDFAKLVVGYAMAVATQADQDVPSAELVHAMMDGFRVNQFMRMK